MIAHIKDLTPDPKNARKHTPRNIGLIEAALGEVGAARSIVIDEDGVVLAGNATIEAAAQAGIERVQVVDADGETIIAVRRRGLTPEQKTKLALYDNRAAELADWDASVLAALAEETDLSGLFRDEEMAAILERAGTEILEQADTAIGIAVYGNDAIIDAAFAYFRATGFPYRKLPIHVCMQEINKLAETEADKLLRTDTAYHVADTYHPHRFHATADSMKSPVQAFGDDALLQRACRLMLEHDRALPATFFDGLKIVSGTQMCSNFRPGFASYLYRRYCEPGATVLDTSTGYGGRLVGFMASGIAGRYIGIDPNVPTHDGNMRMASDLGFADKVELLNLPAEDVPIDLVAGRCDFAFTSPPYFAKEHYSDDDTQSWVRYKTGEDWRRGFLEPMMRLQYASLKPDAYAIVNIADVKIRGKVYPLVDWTIAAARATGFEYIRTDKFELTNRFGAGMDDEVAYEPVLIFRRAEAAGLTCARVDE